MIDQLKGTFGRNPQPKVFAQYSSGPHPLLFEPRRDPLDRTGEQTVISFKSPSFGKVTTRSGRSRASVEALPGKGTES